MDLRDTPSQQLKDHIDLLRKRFTWDTPPPPQFLEEMSLEMREHALFLEAFLLPKIEDPVIHMPSLRVIRGVGAGAELVHPEERNEPEVYERVLTLVAAGPEDNNNGTEER